MASCTVHDARRWLPHRGAGWRCALRSAGATAFALALAGCGTRHAPASSGSGGPDTFPPLVPPLDSVTITATVGEFRTAHFHAGLDFSTHSETGHAVLSPLTGSVVRVRTSGGGYGRNVFIADARGHTILFGHLDAFDAPLAAIVDSAQNAAGDYEQDIPLPFGRVPVQAGQRIGWSGSSGAGPPHLHMEYRRGDTSVNPLVFGLPLPDTIPPVLQRLVLQPLEGGWVARRSVPRSVRLAGRADTVVVSGRARAWVGAIDPGASGAKMAPYAIAMDWNGGHVEARFDSVVWDDDMVAAEWVYDAGAKVSRSNLLALGFGPGFRDVIYAHSGPGREGGVIEVHPGDPARPLALAVRDAAGNATTATVWIRGPRADEEAPLGAAPRRATPWPAAARIEVTPERAAGTTGAMAPFDWQLPEHGVFETTTFEVSPPLQAARMAGMAPASAAWEVRPGDVPLRRPAHVAIAAPADADRQRIGLYVLEGRAFRLMAIGVDSTGRVAGATRAVGRFALYTDDRPPVIGRRRIHVLPGAVVPYSRWALESHIADAGSGLDVRRTFYTIDGRKVPSEYDVDMVLLRWRPSARPAPGRHTYEVTATDRAGNVTHAAGAFTAR